MKDILGEDYADFEKALGEANVRAVRVNRTKISVENFLDRTELTLSPIEYAEDGFIPESCEDYVLPDIEDAMQAGNWFDSERDDTDNEEIQVLDGFYSVQDKVGDLFTNEQLIPIVKGWIMSSDHLDNGEKMLLISRLHNWGAMWGDRTIYEIKMLNESFTPLEKARLNRALSKIRK